MAQNLTCGLRPQDQRDAGVGVALAASSPLRFGGVVFLFFFSKTKKNEAAGL